MTNLYNQNLLSVEKLQTSESVSVRAALLTYALLPQIPRIGHRSFLAVPPKPWCVNSFTNDIIYCLDNQQKKQIEQYITRRTTKTNICISEKSIALIKVL